MASIIITLADSIEYPLRDSFRGPIYSTVSKAFYYIFGFENDVGIADIDSWLWLA